MRTNLAESLLARTLNWTPEEISTERRLLQNLGNFKYDGYYQFSHGIRFIESLMRWLKQFETIEEKKIAYEFVKKKLIFISNEQMLHLVNVSFSEKVRPRIIKKSADTLGINPHYLKKIISSTEYKANERKTLFIGLSDGSRIDQFRRASKVDNEQVSTTYVIRSDKAEEMIRELQNAHSGQKFNSVFLIDDFTASGKSYFRYEEERKIWKGKIYKFLRDLFEKSQLDALIDKTSVDVHILFYLATAYSLKNIEGEINNWKEKKSIDLKITIDTVQLIEDGVSDDVRKDEGLVKLCEKYFDKTIIDKHYQVGKLNKPFLGFDECALPLVLNHNSPNNSLPLLWLQEDKSFRGLFPRVTRHKDEQ